MAEVAVVIRVDTQGAESAEQLIRQLDGAAGASGRAAQAGAALAAIQRQQAQAAIQLATAEGDHTKALGLIQSQLDQTSSDTLGYLALLGQQEAVERRASAAVAEQAAAQQAAAAAARRRAAEEATKARAAQQSADAEIRLAIAERDYGRALSLIQTQLGTTTAGTARYSELLSRQVAVTRQVETAQKRLQNQLSQAAAAETRAAQQAAAAEAQARREREENARSAIRAAVAHQDYGRALALVQARINSLRPGTTAYNNELAEQARIAREAAASTQGSSSALDDLIGNLGGAAVAFQALRVATEGFRLDAQVDASNRSLRVFLGNSQQANEILEAGARFGKQYAFTQTEVADGLRTSAQLFEQTNASADKTLETIARLGEKNTAEGFQGAAYAIRELLAGDTTSLVERFNIPRKEAIKLRDEINAGRDPIEALDAALNKMGATTELLEQRTKGSQGALNNLKVESENAKIAVGDLIETFGGAQAINLFSGFLAGATGGMKLFANQAKLTAFEIANSENPGLTLIQTLFGIRTETDALAPAADNAGYSIGSLAQNTGIATEKSQEHAKVQRDLASALLEQAGTSASADVEAAKLALTQQRLEQIARGVENGTLGLAEAQGIVRAEFGKDAVEVLKLLPIYQELIRLQALLNLPGAVGKGVSNAVGDATKAVSTARQQIADAQYALLTNEQKLAALRQRLAGGNLTELERLRILKDVQSLESQIAADQQRNAKAATTAANKAERQAEQAAREAERAAAELEKARDNLRTTEQKLADRKARLATATDETSRLELVREIRDLEQDITEEREKQLKAALDARELALDDAEADAEALKRRQQAQAILRNEATSEAQKAAARRTLERLRIEDAQRALELAEKQREAGNQVALPGGPAVPGTVASGAAVPLGPVVPVGVPSVAIPGMVTPTAQALRLQLNLTANLIVDGAVAARAIFPSFEENVVSAMNGAFDRTMAAGVLETGGP